MIAPFMNEKKASHDYHEIPLTYDIIYTSMLLTFLCAFTFTLLSGLFIQVPDSDASCFSTGGR
jgi:hypothetical protein